VYAIVLAGGYATRLWPLTKGTPKALLPIAGKPILDYIVEKLQALQPPMDTIILSTNLLFEAQFEVWLATAGFRNVELVSDISRHENEKPGAIKAMAEIIQKMPDDDVLVIAGDGMFNDDLSGLLGVFEKKKESVAAIYEVVCLEDAKRCATVTLDHDNKIVTLIEKPFQPITKKVCGAVYLFKKGVKKELSNYLALGLPSDQPGRFIEWLCQHTPVYGYKLSDPLWDIGTHEAYKACDKYFDNNLLKEVQK
jgi:glucose-1-phosphate thymidylyltransferase